MHTRERILRKTRIRERIKDPDWIQRVLLLGCIICGKPGPEPHHLTRGDAQGNSWSLGIQGSGLPVHQKTGSRNEDKDMESYSDSSRGP